VSLDRTGNTNDKDTLTRGLECNTVNCSHPCRPSHATVSVPTLQFQSGPEVQLQQPPQTEKNKVMKRSAKQSKAMSSKIMQYTARLPGHSGHPAVSANSCPSSAPVTCNMHNIQVDSKTSLHSSDINLLQIPINCPHSAVLYI
jgi:hypothetical protein